MIGEAERLVCKIESGFGKHGLKMEYYPVLLDIKNKDCLVVGGGPVGARKAKGLLRSGARVVVVSAQFSDRFQAIKMKRLVCRQKSYETTDLKGMTLVFAATNDARLNEQILTDARSRNILCSLADLPKKSDFILPSVLERGDLILAVSTSGASPALAKKIRQDLETHFGSEYETILTVMGNLRQQLLDTGHDPEAHKNIFYTLIESGLLEMIKEDDQPKIDRLFKDLLGDGYNYQALVSQRSNE